MEKKEPLESTTNDTSIESPTSPKIKPKNRGKKRKRIISNSSSDIEDVMPENLLEIEKNVHASAVKNNLDDVSVKKILKKVVTNDHVLAYVKLREEEEESSTEESRHAPKLTRSKVKELMKASSKSTWNLENLELTPIKHIPVKTRPEVKALIAQELPEDEDDDEYEPTHEDVPSDDDQTLESCSDLDSQPRTPATPKKQYTPSPKVVRDGPFKVPQTNIPVPARRKLELEEEEATIALRTRSKLSLSETPIEHIESSFVPPDDLPMPAVDDLWNQFLAECLDPAPNNKHEDDDETDPEYNVAADPDAPDEDEEALENSIIKISKKELNDLVTELFNIMPEATADDELAVNMASSVLPNNTQVPPVWVGKQEPLSGDEGKGRRQSAKKMVDRITFEKSNHTKFSIGKSEPADVLEYEVEEINTNIYANREIKRDVTPQSVMRNKPMVEIAVLEKNVCVAPPPNQAEPPPSVRAARSPLPALFVQAPTVRLLLPEQVLILQQQLRIHIQLATSNFLQLFIHPAHWTLGPTYKEFLESLNLIAEANPESVVNVCNLKPAVELTRSWEESVSENTPENAAMVKFIQEEGERSRRRWSQNHVFGGEFPDTLKYVVANSSVFLYPHLLPPVPYRLDLNRRFCYLPSEDELMVLALDQFWSYVEANPTLFKRPQNPKGRWGLTASITLLSRHVLPWMSPRLIHAHLAHCRRPSFKDNPIYKYFKTREIKPVVHKLLPFDPNRTLYEQPEHEVPKVWVRYLAKTNPRFKKYLYQPKQKQHQIYNPTGGVPIHVVLSEAEQTNPTQQIKPKDTQPVQLAVLPSNTPNTSQVKTLPPVSANIFKLVQTSTGAQLVPLSMSTNTVYSTVTPIVSVPTVTSKSASKLQPNTPVRIAMKVDDSDKHCECCILLRKIWNVKQMLITDYLKNRQRRKICYCKNGVKKYPRISNKLRLFLNRYKSLVGYSFISLQAKLNSLDKEIREEFIENKTKNVGTESDILRLGLQSKWISQADDLEFVKSFQAKLTFRISVAKNVNIKQNVNRLLSRFDLDGDDPIKLTNELYKAFGIELVDLYKEFLCFLTPEQADNIGKFKDYFVQNYAPSFVKLIEEQVSNKHDRYEILSQVLQVFRSGAVAGCCLCSALLKPLQRYPALALHLFQLFPHKQRDRPSNVCEPNADIEDKQQNRIETVQEPEAEAEDTLIEGERSQTANYEADNSSSDDDERAGSDIETETTNHQEANNQLPDRPIIKMETQSEDIIDTPELTICKTEIQEYSESDASMVIASEDEMIKSETTDWKREEDKLILEVLKDNLTPEERKDKTIMEIAEQKSILEMLSQSLTHKSFSEIRERVVYLLKMLIISEK
ncbi:uncharacterized protein ACR2FA_009358 [Aphomia sociella]